MSTWEEDRLRLAERWCAPCVEGNHEHCAGFASGCECAHGNDEEDPDEF